MATILRQLTGHSKSQVYLISDHTLTFVRKVGDISRNLERYHALAKLNLSIPKILTVNDEYYDMEYLPNLDIKTYLLHNQITKLSNFIKATISTFASTSTSKDYTQVYQDKLKAIDFSNLPFTLTQLLDKLPKVLPSSCYHGDLTLENILYSIEDKFVMIDPLTTDYDSYVFDLAKLRQDLKCHWFIRHESCYIESKLQQLLDELSEFEEYNNDYLLILMLLRVLPYTTNDKDKQFLMKEINILWK